MVDPGPRTMGHDPNGYGKDYNASLDTFSRLPETMALPPLKVIYWNSEGWNGDKTRTLTNMAGQRDADIIFITNVQINFFRYNALIKSITDRLGESKEKRWTGVPSPNRHQMDGGSIVLFSDIIKDPEITQHLPHGKLTHLMGSWHDRVFEILSVHRPQADNIPKGQLVTDEMYEGEALLWSYIGDYSEDTYILLLGDFNLSPDQLDDRLSDDAPESRRIMTIDSDQPLEGAVLAWNGPGSPVVTSLAMYSAQNSTRPILVEIKLPPQDWTSHLYSPTPSTSETSTTNETDAPPEAQQQTTKGGHNDDQRK